ncbi:MULTISPECIES: TraB/GumN family protein [unclassified Sphingomonas]|uniref:TraB/GumN family protein n=1 Tax=unclassified Sphingomonas TaxID=196159 RepID=UPI00286D3A4D|nr:MULTISPECIES: TraB/GumN family protein [unclassified Sphingomonas]
MKTALTSLALMLALPACAQSKPAQAPNDADPALWVVKDADTTIYLFGTIHVLKPGLTWFDEAVKTAFDKSDQLVLEMVEPDKATMQQIVLKNGFSPTGPTLTEQLPTDKRGAYLKAIADLGAPPQAFDRMKPWLAAVTLSIAPLQKQGYDPANGPEKVLTEAARSEGKPVEGLETAEQQIGYFNGLSPKAQIEFLTSTVDEMPKAGEEMAKMVDEWAHGDPDALARDMNESLKDSPEVAKTLLTDRNGRWASWIKQRLAKPGTIFMAVGAGHLAGDDSVQAQLAKQGIKAQRIAY